MHNRGSETVRPSCRGWDNQNACTNAWAALMDVWGGVSYLRASLNTEIVVVMSQ